MPAKYSVKNYMATKLVTFSPDTDVYDAIETLLKNKISGAPVLDQAGNLVGVLSERDCLMIDLDGHYNDLPYGTVQDFMSREVKTVTEVTSIFDVAVEFSKVHYRRFVVVDEEENLVGQISRRDVLRAIHEMKQERDRA